MINLIPPEGHKMVKREYYARLSATLGLLFATVAVFLVVAQVPTFVLLKAQINSFAMEAVKNNTEGSTMKAADAEVQKIKNVLTQLKSSTSTVLVSDVIEEMQRHTTNAIAINGIAYDTNKDGSGRLLVQGHAKTRADLAQFKSDIEASDMFVKADIPIGDLAKDVDLTFGITITVAKDGVKKK